MQAEVQLTYGRLGQHVFEYYRAADIFDMVADGKEDMYWASVKCFLDDLHRILYTRDYSYSLARIHPSQYNRLTEVCVDNSFNVVDILMLYPPTPLAEIRLGKRNSLVANLAYNIIPFHIMYLRDMTGLMMPTMVRPTEPSGETITGRIRPHCAPRVPKPKKIPSKAMDTPLHFYTVFVGQAENVKPPHIIPVPNN